MAREVSLATESIYPLGNVGEAVTLHEGPFFVNEVAVDGRIELRLLPRPAVTWEYSGPERPRLGSVTIRIPIASGGTSIDGECTSRGLKEASGTITAADIGSLDKPLKRVVVNWLNLPSVRSPGSLYDKASRQTFAGRWTAVVGGWRLTLDKRVDHKDVWQRARDTGAIVVTHVMEICKDDGSTFTGADVEPVIDATQLGMSFAVGRMVAPVLPVGLNDADERVWCQWSPRLCTAGAPGALRWWFEEREWGLAEMLSKLVARFVDPEERFSLRFLLTSAVLSAAGGFVEQRVMTAFAALEHFAFTRLVGSGELTRSEYDHLGPASERVAAVLRRAAIPCEVDGQELSAFHEAETWLPSEIPISGPGVAAWVRNKIVHPTHGDVVYRYEKMLVQTWLLVNHYLVLLILHDLGYSGSYQRRLVPGGCAGEVHLVPWAVGDI